MSKEENVIEVIKGIDSYTGTLNRAILEMHEEESMPLSMELTRDFITALTREDGNCVFLSQDGKLEYFGLVVAPVTIIKPVIYSTPYESITGTYKSHRCVIRGTGIDAYIYYPSRNQ